MTASYAYSQGYLYIYCCELEQCTGLTCILYVRSGAASSFLADGFVTIY